jgi:hypothetical protein
LSLYSQRPFLDPLGKINDGNDNGRDYQPGSQGNIEKMGNDTHHDNRADQYFDKYY